MLTASRDRAYIPPIDAVAEAAGAKNLFGNRAGAPDLGREARLVLWRLSSSDDKLKPVPKEAKPGLTNEANDLKSGSSRVWPQSGRPKISLTEWRLRPEIPGWGAVVFGSRYASRDAAL